MLERLTHSNVGLFLSLSSIFLVYPHLAGSSFAGSLLSVIFSVSIVLSLSRLSRLSRKVRFAYVSIGIAATISTWLPTTMLPFGFIVSVLYSLFFGMSVLIHFQSLISDPEVDTDTLLGASCTYMLIGLFFASVNAVFLEIDPTCIELPADGGEPLYQLIYYSFITLTTVGYGDVLPMSNVTRMLAAYESIIGQGFVAVIVGLLVSKHSAQRHDKEGESVA